MAENLLDTVYLPEIDKKNFYEGKPYQLLKENNNDTSQLEGYQEKSQAPLEFEDLSTYTDKEEWIAKHAGPDVQKEFFSALGDFVLDLGKDGIRSLAVGATNGVDFAVNLAPTLTKLYDLAPVPFGGGGVLEASGVQEDIITKATKASDQLEDAREFLKNFKDDGNVVSKLVQVMGQDLMYSMPMYKKLKSVGIPTVPAFVISGGVGGAIGIEKKLKFTGDDKEQYNSTFTQDFFGKDIAEFKRLVGILPNTPYEEIADEVTQALEYGAFSYAIPKVIDGLKFMKNNIPYFAGGAAVATIPTDAEANPFKSIVKAVTNAPIFKSAVIDAAEKKITKGPGQQVFNTIKNTPGVKESELKWMGLENFLKDKKNVTQEEVLEFINANKLDVNERRFGAADMKQGQVKPLKDFSDEEIGKLEDRIFEDIENGVARDEHRYVADHIGYLREAKFQRLDNFKIRKTEFSEGFDAPDITDQNYNMGSYMNDNYLYRAVSGLDDYGEGAIGFDYWDNTFGEFYEVFTIKSKGTKTLVDDALELQLYKKFAEEQMTLPDEMVRNADVNSGFHIQADAFDDFKKYLDDAGAYIHSYHKLEIPKDQRKAVFDEVMIRSNEEVYYQNSGDMDSVSEALDGYIGSGAARPKYEQYTEAGGEAYSELVFTLSKGGENVGGNFPIETPITKRASTYELDLKTSPHFNVSGEIAHVRFKTREQGNIKILSVEEMQSDLVQGTKQFNERAIENKRRELIQAEGTRQIERRVFENMSEDDVQKMLKDSPPENLIKDFPFRNNWYELTLKRLIRYAADNGFDAISIPKGSVIQDRYGLTRRIDDFNITYFDEMRKEVGLMARDQNGTTQIDEIYTFDRIKEEFGEDVLNRVLKKGPNINDDADKFVDLPQQDYPNIKLAKQIEIGGEGKSQLYNKTIPAFLKKYGKKWNAKIYDDSLEALPSPSMPVTVFEITPEMKQSVQSTSQPLFELFGGVSIGALASQAVSDNIENNIISQSTENMY